MSAARTVVIGLDACDPNLAIELAATGRLPAIGGLLEQGARATSQSPYGLFVGALWPTLTTGRSAAQVGYHSWLEVDPDTLRAPPAVRRLGRRHAVLADALRRRPSGRRARRPAPPCR